MKKSFSALAVAVLSLCLVHQAHCASSSLSLFDVFLNGNQASDAFGPFEGNDANTDWSSSVGGNTYTLLTSSEGDSDTYFQGYEFDLLLDSYGQYTLSWTGGSTATSLDLVLAIKASNSFALYFFNDVSIAFGGGSYDGSYSISFSNPGDQTPSLSHLNVYALGEGGTSGDDPNPSVPEPGTMMLFGAGLVGLAAIGRKRSK